MIQEEFELIIKNDQTLNRFLNEKEIGVLANFSNKTFDNEDFKKYIENSYVESFKEIYNKSMETSEQGKVVNLLRSLDYLATPNFKEEVIYYLKMILDNSFDKLKVLKLSFEIKEDEVDFSNSNTTLNGEKNITIDMAFGFLEIYVINKYGEHEDLNESKNKVLNCCLSICDLLEDADDQFETLKFNTYNSLVSSLGKIHDLGLFKKGYETHTRNVSFQKAGMGIKAFFGFIITMILVCVWAYFKFRHRI